MTAKSAKNWRDKSLNFILNYKLNKCCSCCGWKEHPEILQFHHLKDKLFTIGSNPCEIGRIEREIKKCVLLCPNCHMWLHSPKNKNLNNRLS